MDAKTRWRLSPEGQAYHKAYHVQYSKCEANRKRKADAQRERRRLSAERKEIDRKYNYDYVRRSSVKAIKNEKRRTRRQTDIGYRLTERLRGRIKDLLGRAKPQAISKTLGCTTQELIIYLESKFQTGMTWNNYGFTGWHIDHIRPLSSFDLTDKEQYKQACHYTNLQPLWAKDNLQKGSKYDE